MPSVVEIESLDFAYGKISILSGINLTIEQGEFVGVIGPNGGGKTTLLKLIMGLLEPQKGSVKCFVERIGYVPQTLTFDRRFPITVEELVLGGLPPNWRYTGAMRKKALEAMERAGVPNQTIGTLSGGQLQRALIARALVCDPQLLLLDEPTAHIDVEAEEQLHDLLRSLKMTKLMVTHDLETALKEVDRILSVHGHVHSYEPKELCDHYAHGLYHPPEVE